MCAGVSKLQACVSGRGSGRHSSKLYIKSKNAKKLKEKIVYKKKMQVQGKQTSCELGNTHTQRRTDAHTLATRQRRNALRLVQLRSIFKAFPWGEGRGGATVVRGCLCHPRCLPRHPLCVLRPLLFYIQLGLMLFYAGFPFI